MFADKVERRKEGRPSNPMLVLFLLSFSEPLLMAVPCVPACAGSWGHYSEWDRHGGPCCSGTLTGQSQRQVQSPRQRSGGREASMKEPLVMGR